MVLFNNYLAYKTGERVGKDLSRKIIPSYVYSYSKKETEWFVYGLLNSFIWMDDEIYYIHPSVIFLTMVQKFFKNANIFSQLIINGEKTCIIIKKQDLIF